MTQYTSKELHRLLFFEQPSSEEDAALDGILHEDGFIVNAARYREEGKKFQAHERYEEAIRCYTRAICIAPSDDVSLNLRGICYRQTGKFMEAAHDFNQAAMMRRNPVYLYHKALALADMARHMPPLYEVALEVLTVALHMDPSNPDYQADFTRISAEFERRRAAAINTSVDANLSAFHPEK